MKRVADNAKGMVIAGTGLGHVSSILIPMVKDIIKQGIPVVITSQCLYGATNPNVYQTGRDLKSAGAITAGGMLPETALVKLMWVLGKTMDLYKVRQLMQKNIVGEISNRRFLRDIG